MTDNFYESPLTKGGFFLLACLLFAVGFYMVYAVLRNKPLADPNDPDNFIANLPFWSKDLHRVKLLVGGTASSVFFLWIIIQYLRMWFSG